jgi:hypothetical protein
MINFDTFEYLPNSKTPILKGKIPNLLFDELVKFVDVCNEIKNHPLAYLKNHKNIGKNSYQVSVPTTIIENSFLMAYLNHLSEYYASKQLNTDISNLYRKFPLRRNYGHFDGYDLWINYSEYGSENPEHNHSGSLSGVIYFENESNLPTIFSNNIEFIGQKGDIIIFPAETMHSVPLQKTNNTRITFAYNMDFIEQIS